MGYARLQREPFRLDAVLGELVAPTTGGVTFYVGTVRGDDEGRNVSGLTYEAFAEMAEPQLERLRQATVRRFRLVDAIVIHRHGRIGAGEPILVVALAGTHRQETFDAVEYFMDELKRVIPIWKQQDGEAGPAWIVGGTGRKEPS